jgi:hypothetical protein
MSSAFMNNADRWISWVRILARTEEIESSNRILARKFEDKNHFIDLVLDG